jgi:hypothetical protein
MANGSVQITVWYKDIDDQVKSKVMTVSDYVLKVVPDIGIWIVDLGHKQWLPPHRILRIDS